MLTTEEMNALRNLGPTSHEFPSYAIITLAVCATTTSGCGWRGWMLEGAFRVTGTKENSGTGDKVVPSQTDQICPNCGKTTYRTIISRRFYPIGDK
jgi:predicted RNA-binding Zn-ribbon protein involved in translation (DUF1610 family)